MNSQWCVDTGHANHWIWSPSTVIRSELNLRRQDLLDEIRREEAQAKSDGVATASALTQAAAEDTLDAFMSSVETQVEADKVSGFQLWHCNQIPFF